jgi:hypothetical protein
MLHAIPVAVQEQQQRARGSHRGVTTQGGLSCDVGPNEATAPERRNSETRGKSRYPAVLTEKHTVTHYGTCLLPRPLKRWLPTNCAESAAF